MQGIALQSLSYMVPGQGQLHDACNPMCRMTRYCYRLNGESAELCLGGICTSTCRRLSERVY